MSAFKEKVAPEAIKERSATEAIYKKSVWQSKQVYP